MKATVSGIGMSLALVLWIMSCNSEPTNGPPDSTPETDIRDWSASWNPIENLIAYFHEDHTPEYDPDSSGIYTIRPDGSENSFFFNRPLVNNLSWSPDGRWILFDGGSGSGNMLFRISYPDSVLDTIAGPGQFYAAAWSPDGRIIACVLRAGEVGIYLLDSVGNDYHRIIPYSDFPSWAYSDSIIYTSYEEGFPFGSICISDTGGIYKRLIIDNGVYEFPNMTYVKFNRITGRIIFNSRDRYPDMGLWGMEPNQDTIRLILRGCDEADFSPDGNQIVFTRISAGFGNLWIINWDGTGLRILTP